LIATILFVSGSFRSFVMTGLTTLAFSEVEKSEMPSATTLSQVSMQLATAMGVSMSGVLFEISRTLRGGVSGPPTAGDCRIALVVMAVAALAAVPMFLQLPHDAGSVLSGHRGRRPIGPAAEE
jgi:hypothetical protein